LSALNYLIGTVIRIQYEGIDSEVIIQLSSGETFAVTITQISAEGLVLQWGLCSKAMQ
jgi:molybdate transport system regulatory protein